ncbi:MAG: DUF4349 domain-containing protein [Candidatus Sulfotelmatobacter sp.]
MSSIADSVRASAKPWLWIVAAIVGAVLLAAIATPNLLRSRMAANESSRVAQQRALETGLASNMYYRPATKAKPAAVATALMAADQPAGQADPGVAAGRTPHTEPNAGAGRKIIRTSSIEMVVQHPAEVADRITAIAVSLGGYVMSAGGGGQNATAEMLTLRVPAAHFDQARAEIRKLALRVENEKLEAQDVTRQYVDEDANLRNLRAEETQYLTILKQAHTVKDMLAVSEKLSEVRGQIEQQQAEFNALSQQIETVAISISLRSEAEAQVFALNWRPLYQLKLALRVGLDSLASYATAMTSVLFYLPAVLLWLGTIVLATVIGWRAVRWVGRRWFGWKATEATVQG